MFLRKIADFCAVSENNLARIRLAFTRKNAKSRSFSGTVIPENHDARTLVNRKINARKNNIRTVSFGNIFRHNGSASACRRLRKTQICNLLFALNLLSFAQKLLRPANHILSRNRLSGLSMQASALFYKPFSLFFRNFALAASAFFINCALTQISFPSHGIHVYYRTLRIEMPDFVHRFVKQFGRMRNNQKTAFVFLKIIAKPHNRIGIQMIGRLVQNKRVRLRKKNAHKFYSSALTSGKSSYRFSYRFLIYAQIFRRFYRFMFCRISSCIVKISQSFVILIHRPFHDFRVGISHVFFDFAQSLENIRQIPGRCNSVKRTLFGICNMRILRKKSDFAACFNISRRWKNLSRNNFCQCRFSGAVSSDQTYSVAFAHMKIRRRKKQTGSDAYFQSLRVDCHNLFSFRFARRYALFPAVEKNFSAANS